MIQKLATKPQPHFSLNPYHPLYEGRHYCWKKKTLPSVLPQIELLWRRSLGNHDGGLFCLVNVDLLDYSVSQKAADTLSFLLQESWYNRNEGDVSSYWISKITLLQEFDEKKVRKAPQVTHLSTKFCCNRK